MVTATKTKSSKKAGSTKAPPKTKKEGKKQQEKKANPLPQRESKLRADGCRDLASKSDDLSTPQVRILRALAKVDKTAGIGMKDLKERVGIAGKYTASWLKGLKALEEAGLIRVSISQDGRAPEESGRKRHFYSGTAKGNKVLEKLEKMKTQAK